MAVAPLARLSARLNNGQPTDRRAQLGLTAAYSMFAGGSRRPKTYCLPISLRGALKCDARMPYVDCCSV